ncbi:MAG: hypothetical protein KAS71_02405 [Bacteroidales bacterium]|nr:hypothetical protein [Bacteroidales bacterium]
MKKRFLLAIIFSVLLINVYSQAEISKWEVRGYLSNMQSVMVLGEDQDWISDNLFHNRINTFWYPNENFTASLQFRNRFMYGQSIQLFEGYAKSIDNEQSFLDLSMNILDEKSFFLNTAIDRAYFQYTLNDFVFTLGRQRINWGQTFAWNPNDIFNVQNFFDFDYAEKPGSDAFRIQYYPNYSSSLEIAAKLDHQDKLTLAGYYRFNKWSYDFQFLGGILAEEDYLAGLGWSGDIKGAGFRGEMSYFQPIDNFKDTTGIFYSSISLDYTFGNSIYIQAEGLFSILPDNFNINSFMEYYQGPLTVKNLSFSKWNWFAQMSYPITPLLNMSIAGMYFPDLKWFYAGPSMAYSLKDNTELSLISQVFSGEFSESGDRSQMYFAFLRYKFSF